MFLGRQSQPVANFPQLNMNVGRQQAAQIAQTARGSMDSRIKMFEAGGEAIQKIGERHKEKKQLISAYSPLLEEGSFLAGKTKEDLSEQTHKGEKRCAPKGDG